MVPTKLVDPTRIVVKQAPPHTHEVENWDQRNCLHTYTHKMTMGIVPVSKGLKIQAFNSRRRDEVSIRAKTEQFVADVQNKVIMVSSTEMLILR